MIEKTFRQCIDAELERIRKELEKRHRIELPKVGVKYSDNLAHAFTIYPLYTPSWMSEEEKNESYGKRYLELIKRGLSAYELKETDPSRFSIFIPRKYEDCPTRLYGCLWEEMGHIAAQMLGIKNRTANEGLALAYRFRGMLLGAKEAKYSLEEAVDQIEIDAKRAERDFNIFTKLESMGLKAWKGTNYKHYYRAFFAIKKYNPNLKFRNRDPEELIEELDNSIRYILSATERVKTNLKELASRVKSFFMGYRHIWCERAC